MANKHGKNAEIWLDAVDVSGFFNDLGVTVDVDTAETTTFKKTWKTYIEGVAVGKIAAKGYFDAGNDVTLMATVLNGGSVLTAFPAGALAVGDLARLMSVDNVTPAESSPVGGAVLVNVSWQTKGVVGFGYALHTLSTDTNSTTGTGNDDGAQTTTGWQAHLHVTGVSAGSWVVKLQDSADNSSWSDVSGGAFTAATAATSQRLTGAAGATLRRYVRYVATRTGGTAGDNITFGLAIARHS